MKYICPILLLCTIAVSAQSGRQKPTPTPTPRQITGPSVVYLPPDARPLPGKPSPSPSSTPGGNEDVIKVDAALVPIPVSVTDRSGRSVSSLKMSDFELQIDGKVAEIGDLARSETPIRLAMLFDNSSSVSIARDFEKEAAVRFFKRVVRPEKDLAALYSVADYTRREQPFTNNIDLLVRAIELFPEPKGATALLDGILEVSEYLRSANGRRVLIIVSDGEDTYSELSTTLEGVIRSLQLSDCQVFVVKTKDFENYKRTGIRAGNANIRALTAERRMIEITRQTGGEVYSPIDEREMDEAFDRISAELSQQYILSYYPDDESNKRGDFRSITVGVKGKPELTVRTRKGYYVPKR